MKQPDTNKISEVIARVVDTLKTVDLRMTQIETELDDLVMCCSNNGCGMSEVAYEYEIFERRFGCSMFDFSYSKKRAAKYINSLANDGWDIYYQDIEKMMNGCGMKRVNLVCFCKRRITQ